MHPCSICGKGQLVSDTRDVPFTYKGYKTFIKNIQGKYCSVCGHGYYGPDDDPDDRLMAGMSAFREKVDAVLAEQAEFVARVRKQLGLDQREAGEIFGGGHNAFSRYETGKAKPPRALLQLLAILDHHPELLGEIMHGKATAGTPQELHEEVPG